MVHLHRSKLLVCQRVHHTFDLSVIHPRDSVVVVWLRETVEFTAEATCRWAAPGTSTPTSARSLASFYGAHGWKPQEWLNSPPVASKFCKFVGLVQFYPVIIDGDHHFWFLTWALPWQMHFNHRNLCKPAISDSLYPLFMINFGCFVIG